MRTRGGEKDEEAHERGNGEEVGRGSALDRVPRLAAGTTEGRLGALPDGKRATRRRREGGLRKEDGELDGSAREQP